VVLERITNRPGPGRDIGVLRPGGSVAIVKRDAHLAGVVDALVLTRQGSFDEASLGVTRVSAGGLERYDLSLPGGWRLALEGAAVNAAGVIAFPVYAVVDATVTAVAYAATTDRAARLVPGSYRASAPAGMAGDARHLVFMVETPSGMRLAVWHPPSEASARYLAGTVPEGGQLLCWPGAAPCGYVLSGAGTGTGTNPGRP
jgi:hypothetical protein